MREHIRKALASVFWDGRFGARAGGLADRCLAFHIHTLLHTFNNTHNIPTALTVLPGPPRVPGAADKIK